jgi:L-amino acid N-acyltransferase YncA
MAVIRAGEPRDAAALCRIYNYYIRDTVVTFEESEIDAAEMAARMAAVSAQHPWLVREVDGTVVGYAYASPWKTRSAYRFALETTVYLAAEHTGQGHGLALYQVLLERLRSANIHRAIGCISLPNAASIGLHEKLGFRKVGQFTEVGWKFDRWIDVGYWELVL